MSSPSSIDMSERLRTDYAWTPRQRDVLRLIAAGKTNGEIGVALGISLDGAKWHVGEILSKLGAHSREEAADYWRNYNRPQWRMRRTLRGLALGTGAFKWAAGGVVAASAIAAGIAVIVAVQSSGDDNTRAALPASATAAATSTTTATPTATTVAAPGYPLGTTTNDPQLDAVIDALTSGDPARVMPLLQFYPIGCMAAEFRPIASPPPCAPGVADGTPVDVFPSLSCPEGRYATRDTIDALAQILGSPGNRLYSVYRPVPLRVPFGPPASAIIVLTGPAVGAPPPAYSPRFTGVTDGKIVVAGVGCPGQPVEKYFSGGDVSEYLLPPPGSAATPTVSSASPPTTVATTSTP